jgi:hypothetical protein
MARFDPPSARGIFGTHDRRNRIDWYRRRENGDWSESDHPRIPSGPNRFPRRNL